MSSLGNMERLPLELRKRVYLLSANWGPESVEIWSDCAFDNPFYSVSRALRAESEAEILQSGISQRQCPHTEYTFSIPQKHVRNESITVHSRVETTHRSSRHNISNAKVLRFLTGHLGKDVPLAIVINLDLPGHSSYVVYGASAWKEKAIQPALDEFMRINVHNALNGIFPGRSWVRPKDIEDLAVAIRMAVTYEDGDDGYEQVGYREQLAEAQNRRWDGYRMR